MPMAWNQILGGLAGWGTGTAQQQDQLFQRNRIAQQDARQRNLDVEHEQDRAKQTEKDRVLGQHLRNALQGDQAAQAEVIRVEPSLADRFVKPPSMPRTHYDADRGVMVDEDKGTASPIAGLPPKPHEPSWEAQKGQAIQRRVMELVAKRVPLADANRQARLEYGETSGEPNQQPPSTQSLQTPAGYVSWDPKHPTAAAQPIVGQTGEQVKPEPPRPPAQLLTAYNTNRKQMTILDNAMADLKQHPGAVGLMRGRSDALDQRLDPEGVNARASIADVGSLVIHDRSGAAVTASEAPRLKPFIPLTSDNYETVVKKLTRMRALVEQETNYLQDQVGGYTNPGGTPNPSHASSGVTAAQKRRAATDPEYARYLRETGKMP